MIQSHARRVVAYTLLAGECHGLAAVGGHANHAKVRLGLQQLAQGIAEEAWSSAIRIRTDLGFSSMA